MKKFYSLLSAMLLAVLTSVAQTTTISWGYSSRTITSNFGETLQPKGAIYIPADIAEMYKGCEVTGIRVGLAAAASNFRMFVTSDLNGTPILEDTYPSEVQKGFTNISFTSGSYTITGEPFFIGFECEGADAAPLALSDAYDVNGCWADLGDGWKDYATDPTYNSCTIALLARIKGSTMPYDLALNSVSNVTQKKNTPITISGTVTNLSPKLIREFQLGYSIDGGEEQIVTVSKQIGSGNSSTFSFDIDGLSDGGTHPLNCRIVSLGDKEDAYDGNNHATASIGIVERFPKYRMVAEEGTGTWCVYCPRGIWGFQKMEETYPDNFIGIAIHPYTSGEYYGLVCDSYASLVFSSFPTAYINRNSRQLVTPTFAVLESTYNSTKDNLRLGEIEVKAEYADADKKTINATAYTTFMTSLSDANYRIGFVVTEDNVSGYQQQNGVMGWGDEVGDWSNYPSVVSIDMQHVAREIFGYRGFENSVPSNVTADKQMQYTKTLTTPSKVQTPENVNVIALLYNVNTGLIENGAKCRIGSASSETAIADVRDNVTPELSVIDGKISCDGFNDSLTVYTIDGKQVANQNLKRGIYVVKGINGNQSFVKRIAL